MMQELSIATGVLRTALRHFRTARDGREVEDKETECTAPE